MPKHVLEDDYNTKGGFNKLVHGSDSIIADNSDRILTIEGDGTIDLDIKENKLRITSRVPVFTTKDF